DLILMDLLLPGVHGFDICQEVKKDPRLMHIPIIVMTAVYKTSMDKMEAKRLGVDEFIEKPLRFNELLKKINRLTGTEMEPEPEPIPAGPPEPKEKRNKRKSPSPASATTVSELGARKDNTDAMKLQLKALQQDYADKLPEKIEEMETLWSLIQKNTDNQERLTEFRRLAHKLIGSGTTFGFDEITKNAQQLELLLDMIVMEGKDTLERKKEKIDGFLDNLRLHPAVTTGKQLRKMKI
ncbi:MAG: response regulator, partial [bacterium]|nr:response regulator [bacterium]